MKTLHVSTMLEELCQALAQNIQNRTSNVFDKELIVTQTNGMSAWLKTELARRNGVFANFELVNQDNLFAGIYSLIFGEKLKNNIDNVKYKIFELLDNGEFQKLFPDVAAYYIRDDLRKIQLSEKIATLFDQYQLYRPEIIAGWENANNAENPSEEWQKWLWKNLNIESRAAIRDRMLPEMKAKKDLIRETYPEISLFGITVFTRFHLDFFNSLAEYTNICFYTCLPSNQASSQNELLTSFGSKASELMSMLGISEFIAEPIEEKSLLAFIQNQIRNNRTDSVREYKDDSIVINSCYTPVREVECLYNYLLDLFDKNRSLRPADVLVMVTDINKYAPFIKAVFRTAPKIIPFQVSGASSTSEDTMTASLEHILNFTEADLTSEKVTGLLEQKRIKQRYAIQDTDYIRSVIKKANIRFGRENREIDDTRYVSWSYGLEKILLGYAILDDNEYLTKLNLSLYPFKDAEASVSYDLFRLKAFVEDIESFIDAQTTPRTLARWKEWLFENIVKKMIWHDDFEKDDRAELSSMYTALSFIDNLEIKNELPFNVFLEELKSKLFIDSKEMKLNTGRVTVSPPIPVRGIPFKAICFLGLDNGIFPRKDSFMGFDLLGEKYVEGDRSKKETDKYLFLDTILAAREKLYLSFIGQSVKDNTEIPPSIAVDTLIDYLGSDKIAVQQPLHGFSSRYNGGDDRYFTYLYSQSQSDYATMDKEKAVVAETTIKNLVKFFQAPIDWYFNSILKIDYQEKDNILEETEIFELDNLQEWVIKKDLLFAGEECLEAFIRKGKMEGNLPLGSGAQASIENMQADLTYMKDEFLRQTEGLPESKFAIDLAVDNLRITGTIDGVYGNTLIGYSISKYSTKYKIETFIQSLILFIEGKIKLAKFIDRDGITSLVPTNPEAAESDLKKLLCYFREGHNAPILFTIKASEKAIETDDIPKILKVLNDEAFPDEYARTSPNPYLQALFREDHFNEFEDKDLQRIRDIADSLKFNLF